MPRAPPARDHRRMTRLDANDAKHVPLTTDHAIQRRVAELLDGAIRRQWWTLYLDDDDVQLPLIMPMAGYPERPDERLHVEGYRGEGIDVEGTAAQLLARHLAEIADEVGAARLIFVWERPGSAESTSADREWARALSEACRAEGVAVRAQLILHDRGVRWFAPDDYA
jgi:hypothetical protein